MKYTKTMNKTGKPMFKEKNDIFPVPMAGPTSNKMEKDMFGADALNSQIKSTPDYAKKGSGVADSMNGCSYKKENMVSPDANY